MSLRSLSLSMLSCAALGMVCQRGVRRLGAALQGKSSEQMSKDVVECQGVAKQSSGYDPAAPPPAATEASRRAERA